MRTVNIKFIYPCLLSQSFITIETKLFSFMPNIAKFFRLKLVQKLLKLVFLSFSHKIKVGETFV